jgi:hypothetical protein
VGESLFGIWNFTLDISHTGSSIDETDHRGIGEIIDDVEAAVILVKAEHVLKRESERITEDDPVDRPMTDNQEIPAFTVFQDFPEARHHSFGEFTNCFSISGGPEVHRILHAVHDSLREMLADLLESKSFPVAKVEFPEFGTEMEGNIVISGDDAGSLHRPLKVAGIYSLNLREAKTIGELLELEDTHLGEGYVRVSINGQFIVTVHLPVSDQV